MDAVSDERLRAIVLVGGLGTRLRPITYTVPKQLIPLAGQPVLYHVLDLLPRNVEEATLACGYKAEAIEAYLTAHPHRVKTRVVRESQPLGTGGAMRNAASGASDPFFLLNGDVISGIDLTQMLAFHREKGAFGTMSLAEVEDPQPFGVAVLDGEERITRFVEKPPRAEAPSRWINAGVTIWSREVLEQIPDRVPLSFESEVMGSVLSKGIYGFCLRSFWEDAGTPAGILHAQRLLFDHPRKDRLAARSQLEGAQVLPPVAIGRGCHADGAVVGRYVTLGQEVRLGQGAHVEDSILMDGVEVGPGAHILGSIVGPGQSIPPGTVLEGRCVGSTPEGVS